MSDTDYPHRLADGTKVSYGKKSYEPDPKPSTAKKPKKDKRA